MIHFHYKTEQSKKKKKSPSSHCVCWDKREQSRLVHVQFTESLFVSQWGKRCCMIGSIDRQPRGESYILYSARPSTKTFTYLQRGLRRERIHLLLDWGLLSVRLWRSFRHLKCPHTLSRGDTGTLANSWYSKRSLVHRLWGLKVPTLGFRSGFLVAVAAQSGEAGWRFGAGRLGSAVVGLGCVSVWEETAGRRRKETWTLNEHLVKFITKFIIQTNYWCCIWRLKCIISLLQEEYFLENQTLVKTANGEAFMK